MKQISLSLGVTLALFSLGVGYVISTVQNVEGSADNITNTPMEERQIVIDTATAEQPTGALSISEMKAFLTSKLPGIVIEDIGVSPLPGYYEVYFGNEILYVSASGKYVVTGNIIMMDEEPPANLTQQSKDWRKEREAPSRAAVLSQIEDKDLIVYKAEHEKHSITVFTDVDCGYCRKLHKEIPQLNSLGITVRYMAFPRAGLGSDSYNKMVSVWCAADKTKAMDDAKLRRSFQEASCENPIAQHFQYSQNLKLSGTPAVLSESGVILGGYVSASELFKRLTSDKS